ncbi:MAG TPA: heme-binding protein [Candidatus Hydrogenedentes bacterium]|nr:heme-binding protein [Candidatus Hydrogenedentota bacterium]
MAATIIGVIVVLLGAWTAVGYNTTKGIETPEYTSLKKANGYEIREYAPYIRAEVNIEGSYRKSLYSGFREVADYIFGNNTRRADIAMTAPVISEKAQAIAMTAPVLHESARGDEAYTVAFVMPREYSIDTLPQPNNPNVRLREVPERRVAVLRFGGYATRGRATRKIAALEKALERDGVRTAGDPVVAQYDPPWTPPYMRHNEIWVTLP